jgi:PncC family amidohydrolase
MLRPQVQRTKNDSDMVIGEPLEETAGRLLLARGMRIAVAESCTGGLVMHWLTNVSGSSRYFLGGVVAYANEAKLQLLGVPQEMLAAHGAVSAETARAMAEGVRGLFGADVTLAVTGIAGPAGGTREKPVGLTYIALATAEAALGREYRWTGSRKENKEASARAALALLCEFLKSQAGEGVWV